MNISRKQLRQIIKEAIGDADGDGTSDKEELIAIASNISADNAPSHDASWKELHAFFNKDYLRKSKEANQKYQKWHNRDRTQGKYGWNISKEWEDLLTLIDTNNVQLELEDLGSLKNYMNEFLPIQKLITHKILKSPEESSVRKAGYSYLRRMTGASDRHASKMSSGYYGKLD